MFGVGVYLCAFLRREKINKIEFAFSHRKIDSQSGYEDKTFLCLRKVVRHRYI